MTLKELTDSIVARASGDITANGDKLIATGDAIKSTATTQAEGTVLEFEAIVTSTRKDRDGDVLECKGCNVDPAAPLLWQHDPQQPIGKLLEVTERSNDKIVAKFAIADTELGRDAAELVKLGALRISHGFRPLDFQPIGGKGNGVHVKSWEMYEVSLVSIPSNVDAIITAFNANKFTSNTIKSWASTLQPAQTQKTETEEMAATTTDTKTTTNPAPATVFGGGSPRVKAPSERYSNTKSTGKHVRTGEAVKDFAGRDVLLPSEAELAKAGVLFKKLAMKSGQFNITLNEHERELFAEMIEKDAWCGDFGGSYETSVTGDRVKALLSDGTSGGTEINPVWFDDMVVQFPLLHSELLPYVDNRSVPRGSSIETASVGNPSVAWGTAEGTAINLFDTASLVADINTSIHPVQVGLEVGRDLLADAAVDVGRVLVENIGQKMLSELDNVVANGNGTDRPEGIFTASGLSTPGSTNGNGGPITVADLESLIFSVGKQYRNPSMRCRFIFNDTVYRRCRGIQVGTSDQRRVLGMDHQSYMLLEHGVSIQNDIANTKMAFGALAKYRLYRRAGMEQRFIDGGATLARKNCVLLIVRGRFGGKVMDAGAFAKITDAQT
ncbi:MAG: phage major capsid protein [Planctomycetaceae bacterium]|nr:phage major capsid protein [Planctomycetaceae bacterium]